MAGSENDEDGSGYGTAAFPTATVPPPSSVPPLSPTPTSSPQPVLVSAGPTEGSLEIESTPSPELSDTSSNGSLETEEPSVLTYAVPAVVLALLVLLVIIFIIVHNQKKSKQGKLLFLGIGKLSLSHTWHLTNYFKPQDAPFRMLISVFSSMSLVQKRRGMQQPHIVSCSCFSAHARWPRMHSAKLQLLTIHTAEQGHSCATLSLCSTITNKVDQALLLPYTACRPQQGKQSFRKPPSTEKSAVVEHRAIKRHSHWHCINKWPSEVVVHVPRRQLMNSWRWHLPRQFQHTLTPSKLSAPRQVPCCPFLVSNMTKDHLKISHTVPIAWRQDFEHRWGRGGRIHGLGRFCSKGVILALMLTCTGHV